MDCTCLSSKSHRYPIWLSSRKFGDQVGTSNLLCSPNNFLYHFCFMAVQIILLKEATASRECRFLVRMCMACSSTYVGGMCQGRTQGFPAGRCPKHYTASICLPTFHSASWYQVFPLDYLMYSPSFLCSLSRFSCHLLDVFVVLLHRLYILGATFLPSLKCVFSFFASLRVLVLGPLPVNPMTQWAPLSQHQPLNLM